MTSSFGYTSPSGHGYTGCRTDIATGTTNGGRSWEIVKTRLARCALAVPSGTAIAIRRPDLWRVADGRFQKLYDQGRARYRF